MRRTVNISVALMTGFYLAVAVSGYLAYGKLHRLLRTLLLMAALLLLVFDYVAHGTLRCTAFDAAVTAGAAAAAARRTGCR